MELRLLFDKDYWSQFIDKLIGLYKSIEKLTIEIVEVKSRGDYMEIIISSLREVLSSNISVPTSPSPITIVLHLFHNQRNRSSFSAPMPAQQAQPSATDLTTGVTSLLAYHSPCQARPNQVDHPANRTPRPPAHATANIDPLVETNINASTDPNASSS